MSNLNDAALVLKLKRRKGSNDKETYGTISIEKSTITSISKSWETLEDEDRLLENDKDCSDKVYSETAIPRGTYQIIWSYSNKFKIHLPLLLNVKCFLGIRIHGGSNVNNSSGCILVGKNVGGLYKGSSTNLNSLLTTIKKACLKGRVYIIIE